MSASPQDTSTEGVPGIPGMQEVMPESSSEDFKFCTETSNHGIRRVSCRAEIDTSPPFESVKEAVIRFGGSGPWVPFYKFGHACHGFEEFDMKKVEEEAAELEKDLIVKELETLDVLEELGTTKRNVEELKRQLKDEALKYMTKTPCLNPHAYMTKTPCLNPHASPAIKEMNDERVRIASSRRPYCSVSSHVSNLMESKQANVIQACVESLARIELNALGGAKGLSSNETSSEFSFPVPEPELTILMKLEEASEEIKHCKKALKEALKSVEIASKKHLDIVDALKHSKMNNFHHNHPRSPLKDVMSNQKGEVGVDPKHVSRPKVSMRDTLSKKQVATRECVDRIEPKKVALSQMLDELKTDLRFHPKNDDQKHHGDVPKQLFTRRGKFGFINLHWKSKPKKKTQCDMQMQ